MSDNVKTAKQRQGDLNLYINTGKLIFCDETEITYNYQSRTDILVVLKLKVQFFSKLFFLHISVQLTSLDQQNWLDERFCGFKSECPLRPSHIENMWHMMSTQNFSYSSQR